MYLFSRRTRLAGGNGMAGVEWAVGIAAKVKEVTGHDVQLWANVYSPGWGTVSWTAWFDSLTSLEAMGDQLGADAGYAAMADAGAAFTEGGLDDAVMQPIYGEPDPERQIQYVVGSQAVVAGGNFERAMGLGIDLVKHGEKVTPDVSTMFVRALTGQYGAVGWLTGYETMAQMEAAMDAQAADPDWLKLIDSTKGAFVEQVGATETTIYRKLN